MSYYLDTNKWVICKKIAKIDNKTDWELYHSGYIKISRLAVMVLIVKIWFKNKTTS